MNYNFKLYKNNCLYNNKHAEEVKKRQAQGGRRRWEGQEDQATTERWQIRNRQEGRAESEEGRKEGEGGGVLNAPTKV